jgi:hypothetical protein
MLSLAPMLERLAPANQNLSSYLRKDARALLQSRYSQIEAPFVSFFQALCESVLLSWERFLVDILKGTFASKRGATAGQH